MKKFFLFSLAVLSIVSCNKTQMPEKGIYDIDASISAVSAPTEWTKSHIDFDSEPFCPVWDENDAVALVTKRFPKGLSFVLTNGKGTTEGHFSSDAALNDTTIYYAVYPASSVKGSTFSSDGATVTVEFPSAYTFNEETRCSDNANFMAASSSDKNFGFKNIHCYLELIIDGPAGDALKSLKIKGKNDEIVAGSANVSFGGTEPSVSFVSGQKEVTLDFGADGLEFSSDVIDIALPPVLQNGFVVTATSVNGKSVVATSSSSSPVLDQNIILCMEDPIVIK